MDQEKLILELIIFDALALLVLIEFYVSIRISLIVIKFSNF